MAVEAGLKPGTMGEMRPFAPLAAAALGSLVFTAQAFAQPQLPATFYGSVTVDGKPAAAGTEVRGLVNGIDCTQSAIGERPVIRDGETAAYVIHVVHETQRPGCASSNSTVTFTIGGRPAAQTAPWKPGPLRLDLSTGAAPPIPLPSPTGTLAAVLGSETPGAGTASPAATASPPLVRPTGTPPTDDVRFDSTPLPPGADDPARDSEDSGGRPVIAMVAGGLLVAAGLGAGAAYAIRRKRPPPA